LDYWSKNNEDPIMFADFIKFVKNYGSLIDNKINKKVTKNIFMDYVKNRKEGKESNT